MLEARGTGYGALFPGAVWLSASTPSGGTRLLTDLSIMPQRITDQYQGRTWARAQI